MLHDFDRSGFSICGTLGTDSRRCMFENEPPVVDMGLQLVDVVNMNLESEPVPPLPFTECEYRARTLKRPGATPEEIDFLHIRRVELNAMTSRQLVDFIEAQFTKYGVKKVIPDIKTLTREWHRLIERRLLDEQVEKWRKRIAAAAYKVDPPANLTEQLQCVLHGYPTLSWDTYGR